MTREETIRLLRFLKGNYPYCKIDDPKGLIEAWMLAFYDDEAKDVYKAARLHMSKNKFFPSPAEVRECMTRANLLYEMPEQLSLQEKNTPQLPSGESDQMSMEELWEWIVED